MQGGSEVEDYACDMETRVFDIFISKTSLLWGDNDTQVRDLRALFIAWATEGRWWLRSEWYHILRRSLHTVHEVLIRYIVFVCVLHIKLHMLHWQSYRTHKYKMHSYWLLERLVYIVTIWLKVVNICSSLNVRDQVVHTTKQQMMEAVRTSETSVDNHFTRQYNPEDISEQMKLVLYGSFIKFVDSSKEN
jgi:hypothetical protein